AANDSPSVVAGDTLYLYPSVSQYDPATINKRLIILGIGYDLSNTLAVEVRPVRVNVISFRYGASGAQISGLVISQISIETSGVNVIANKIEGGIAGSSSTGIQATLQRNWIMGYYYFGNKYSIQNIVGLISNNIIGCHVYIPSSSPGTMSIVAHNVIGYRASAAGCSSGSGFGAYTMVYNNAFYKLSNGSNGLSGASDTQIQYNLFEQASLSGIGSFNQISNNQYGLNFASGIFQLPSSGGPSLDSHFKLAAGSVGLGTGSAGADIGAYGGNTPYKESGLIAIPYVYSIIAPPTGGATVPFSVEIKLISPRTSF
ncbi:MAG TPA: hypothetical protein PLL64_12340, partial [Rhodothermales bacterium]|nr:hypothetical protein [Rhodothermales bacterium]